MHWRIFENGYIGSEEFPEYIDHYLYFPECADAEKAAAGLRKRNWVVNVQKAAIGNDWLALATQPATGKEDMGDLWSKLTAFASQYNGRYDGWERPMDEDESDYVN